MTKDWFFGLVFLKASRQPFQKIITAGKFCRVGSSQQTRKTKAKQGEKLSTLILHSFPTLLDMFAGPKGDSEDRSCPGPHGEGLAPEAFPLSGCSRSWGQNFRLDLQGPSTCPGAGIHLLLELFWSEPFSSLTLLWQESSGCPGSRKLLCSTLCPALRLSELVGDLLNQSCRRQRPDLCGCWGGSWTPSTMPFSGGPWAAVAVLFFTTALQYSCSAGISLLLCSSFYTLPIPPPLSIFKYIAH